MQPWRLSCNFHCFVNISMCISHSFTNIGLKLNSNMMKKKTVHVMWFICPISLKCYDTVCKDITGCWGRIYKIINYLIQPYWIIIGQCVVLHCSVLLRAKDLYNDERWSETKCLKVCSLYFMLPSSTLFSCLELL